MFARSLPCDIEVIFFLVTTVPHLIIFDPNTCTMSVLGNISYILLGK